MPARIFQAISDQFAAPAGARPERGADVRRSLLVMEEREADKGVEHDHIWSSMSAARRRSASSSPRRSNAGHRSDEGLDVVRWVWLASGGVCQPTVELVAHGGDLSKCSA